MNLHTHAANSMRLMGPGRHPADSVPGLPAVPGGRNPQRGATRTFLVPSQRSAFIDVAGQPSMKIMVLPGGGVKTVTKLNSRYAEFMTSADYRTYLGILRDIKAEAERLSQGGVSLAELAKRGHPFGRGLRRGRKRGRIAPSGRAGIPNKAIANRQSGQYARLWSTDILRGKTGADFSLINSAPHAGHLLGTKYMQAHGPQTAAFVKHFNRLLAAWRRFSKDAHLREQAVNAFYG